MSYERSLSALVFVAITAGFIIAVMTAASGRESWQATNWERRVTRLVRPEFLAREFYDA